MPRYCAVKVCRNRRGSGLKEENKRTSFYPFPLHDEARLQQWVNNMRRRGWTPSRHQFLCSEHFTDDCFDVRWGIRYLKNTAVPNVFSPDEDDADRDAATVEAAPQSFDGNKPCEGEADGDGTSEPPLRSRVGVLFRCARGVTGDSRDPPRGEPPHNGRADSAAIVLRCERLQPLSDGEADANSSLLEAALSHALGVNSPLTVAGEPADGGGGGEHISACEHSYSRPDTDKQQLWSRIFSLHAKVLDLDRREESTVAKIHALETEISHLKRDNAVCKAKQKMLEDVMSSKSV